MRQELKTPVATMVLAMFLSDLNIRTKELLGKGEDEVSAIMRSLSEFSEEVQKSLINSPKERLLEILEEMEILSGDN